MIKKDFIEYIASIAKIQRIELIEKDFILQSFLSKLSNNPYFKENFIMKGGTGLIKCYVGYYRFSEDLDFSWIDQKKIKNKSQKQIRKFLSSEIDRLINLFSNIAKELGLGFKPMKNNKRYIEFGGSNTFVTLKLWYESVILGTESFVKIQFNFVEKFYYRFKKKEIKNLVKIKDTEEIRFLFPEYADVLFTKIRFNVYDIREILLEKIRAILTRRGIKARDFIDVFIIKKKLGANLNSYRKKIIEKTKVMLKFKRFKQNLKAKEQELKAAFALGEEEKLLLKPVEKGFNKFLDDFYPFLKDIIKQL